MGRFGVTKEDVFLACAKLLEQKTPVTVANVRNELGTGSYSTLAPLINHFKDGLNSATESKKVSLHFPSELPSELKIQSENLIQTLWGAAKEIAQNQIETIRNELEGIVNQSSQTLTEKNQELEHAHNDLKKYENELELLKSELKASMDSASKKDGEISVLIGNLQSRDKEIEALRLRIESVQILAADALKNKEKELSQLQERFNEEKRKTQDQFENGRRFELDAAHLRDSLSKRDGELSGLRESFNALQKTNELLLNRLITSEKDLGALKSKV